MNYYRSKPENELFEYIESIYPGSILQNERNIVHAELDIFLPGLNLAIEFNGNIFHSDAFLSLTKGVNSKDYHKRKLKLCQSKNIELLYVWEDDWTKNNVSIKENLKRVINGESYDKGLFNKLTKNQKFEAKVIYYTAKNNIPKIKKYFPVVPEENDLTTSEKRVFRKIGFSLARGRDSELLNKDELAEEYNVEILRSLFSKKYLIRDKVKSNYLIVPGKYMKKEKIQNKYKVPPEYFEPSKIISIRAKPDFLIFIITSPEKLFEISEKMSIDGIENIVVDNYIKCQAKGSMRGYDYSIFSKYSKDTIITIFSSTETGKKRFCRLFVDNKLFS